jgi:predicted SAM-dependent methyltransferase
VRVNLGCGQLRLAGYWNVDAFCGEADELADVFTLAEDHWLGLEEVRMDHMLEHVGFAAGDLLLRRCRGWLRQGGLLVVEVPDMTAILARGTADWWQAYIYGAQSHPGEFHLSGYTEDTLKWSLEHAGFTGVETQVFLSDNQNRPGMPCLKATAVA